MPYNSLSPRLAKKLQCNPRWLEINFFKFFIEYGFI
jgi:hypothetical protein